MNKYEKVYILRDSKENVIAGLFFIADKRVLCKIDEMSEDDIIELLKDNNSTIKTNAISERTHDK